MILRDFFFPPKCVFCTKMLENGLICPECERTLPYNQKPFKGVEFAELCTAPLKYEGRVRESVLRYKFGKKQSYSAQYAAMIAEALKRDRMENYDEICWVPVHALRRLKRGYDQAELIVRELAEITGKPCRRYLVKTKNTGRQSRIKGAAARRANVTGAYRAAHKGELRAKRLLLVDDIITTGATASECAKTLLAAGADRVYCAAVATAHGKQEG